jgi:vancomycin resistance protein YoaR
VLGQLDAPGTIDVTLTTSPVEPEITTAEATAARAAAERIASPITFTRGDETWEISAARLRSWTTFVQDADGTYVPRVDTTTLPAVLKALGKQIDRGPRNATFRTKGARITGVVSSRNGRAMDRPATAKLVRGLIAERAAGATTAGIEPVVKLTKPALTTEQAQAVLPKMRKVSSWTTYFPIGIKNAFGANIWIPAMDLNGHVVAPGATFDFWESIGPVTRERGYRDGGAIINGRTEPQGALAGGICSTSTTLFNAALRAGYEMGARRNHYYYIDRYPLGLDATVFKSDSSVQTMSFTNDTRYPILIRAYKIRDGGAGYVRFELWSVPSGRKVSFSRPTVKNVRPATDTIQYTTGLAPGATERVEYPVDGKQVWVTRTVKDKSGAVIHRETYYSNYARITGITLVGRSPSN